MISVYNSASKENKKVDQVLHSDKRVNAQPETLLVLSIKPFLAKEYFYSKLWREKQKQDGFY